jgi:hypothetical protein
MDFFKEKPHHSTSNALAASTAGYSDITDPV